MSTETTSDRLAENPTPLTDEQVAQFAELIDMHRQYGPALSIEGEAQLLVEVLRLRALLNRVRLNLVRTAVELYRQWQHAIEMIGTGPTWTKEHALYCKGKTLGAVALLQSMLAETGEIGPDEANDEDLGAAWALIDAEYQANAEATG